MFQRLFHILNGALPACPSAAPLSKPYVEVLVAQLALRFLLTAKSWQPREASQGIHNLLLLPTLWARCASLRSVAPRICRQALPLLSTYSAQQVVDLLPTDVPGGKAGAAAALLGNLLQVQGGA